MLFLVKIFMLIWFLNNCVMVFFVDVFIGLWKFRSFVIIICFLFFLVNDLLVFLVLYVIVII